MVAAVQTLFARTADIPGASQPDRLDKGPSRMATQTRMATHPMSTVWHLTELGCVAFVGSICGICIQDLWRRRQ